MTALRPLDPRATWQAFARAILRLLEIRVARSNNWLGFHFEAWGRATFTSLASDEFGGQWFNAWVSLHEARESRLHAILLLHELDAFANYVDDLLARLEQERRDVPFTIELPPPDSTGIEESHSILSTVLDSLADAFPALKGLLKTGKEFIDIRKALLARRR